MSLERVTAPVVRKLEAMPLTWRLVTILLVLLLAALMATSLATAWLVQRDLKANVDDQLRAVAVPIAEDTSAVTIGGESNDDFYSQDLRTGPTNFFFVRQPSDGSAWQYRFPTGEASRPDVPVLSLDDPRVRSGQPFTVSSIDGTTRWRFIAGHYTTPDNSTFAVGMPMTGVNKIISRFAIVTTSLGLAALVTCGVLGWFATRRAFRPLRRIEDTAAGIAAGDLTRRVPVRHSHDEVASLSDSLNAMLGQVERSFALQEASETRMRQFVADASHELRTPLATVRGYAELYRQGAVQGPEHTAQAMDRIEGEASRMTGLVDDLLLLARLDDQRPLELTDVDLVVLAAETVHDARARAPHRRVQLVGLDGELSPVVLRGDDSRLRQVLSNLIGNALMHTADDVLVEVRTGQVGDRAVVEVRDHGAGIEPDVAERVFERFFRVDKARSRARGGSGLGLAIVAAIVGQHQGRVRVLETPGGGATFRVELPGTTPERPARV
ncbi:sensor histidine kinase [Janibacter hoylei]|uniref:histidine kinase n=2 Tax=Janibacter TaxID=53457 RepID=A0A444B2P7_9MICO|nr:HAMP domain-containing sensor histidine kinase [Janibacter hoylei]MCW4602120.1 HAMP domain-containing histidine kinase [Janibacter hoylei]RWU82645.1 sensor histidine kinase [Janibacter hoylei PVAS-1]